MENGIRRKPQFSDRHNDVSSPTSLEVFHQGSAVRAERLIRWDAAVRSALCGCANLSTSKGRRNNALLILVIAMAPVVALIIQNAVTVHVNGAGLSSTLRVQGDVLFSTESGKVVHYLQIERGTSALYISSNGSSGLDKLGAKRRDTDEAIGSLTRWVGRESDGEQFASRQVFHQSIRDFRKLVTAVNVTVLENLAFYTADIDTIIGWLADSIQLSQSGRLWPVLVSYHMLVISKEQAGLERALGSTFYAQGGFTNSQMTDYLTKKLLGKSYLERFQQYAEEDTLVDQLYEGSPLQDTIEDMRSTIVANAISQPDVEMGQQWFENMTLYINILKKTQDEVASNIVSGLDLEILQQQDELFVSVSIMVAAVLLLLLVIFSVSRLTRRLQAFAVSLQEKTVALSIERKRSENLLNELLPPTVARKLMANEPVEPESFQAVTIFFSDIVGFTSISSKSSPMQVIAMLNMLYKTFDETLDMYNVYKVETIGDAYMVASGLPVRNEDGHAVEIAELSLEIRSTICDMSVPHLPDHALQIRIGLNSGSVVSGVVGNKMPRYCLFGDTVNVASRMESSGVPDKIQISGSTFAELSRRGGFQMEERGEVEIKGKGKMITYFLNGQTDHVRRRNVPPNLHT